MTLSERAIAAHHAVQAQLEAEREAQRLELQRKLDDERYAVRKRLEAAVAASIGTHAQTATTLVGPMRFNADTSYLEYAVLECEGESFLVDFARGTDTVSLGHPLRHDRPQLIVSAKYERDLDEDFGFLLKTAFSFTNLAELGALLLEHPNRPTRQDLDAILEQVEAGS